MPVGGGCLRGLVYSYLESVFDVTRREFPQSTWMNMTHSHVSPVCLQVSVMLLNSYEDTYTSTEISRLFIVMVELLVEDKIPAD